MEDKVAHTAMSKRRKIFLWVILGSVVYLFSFGGLSVLHYVENRSYYRTAKVLTSDGARLYVGDKTTGKTYDEVFFQRTPFVDGLSAYAWMEGQTLHVQYGDKKFARKCNSTDYPMWSPTKEELYFIDTEKDQQRKMRIWKWSLATSFVPITKVEDDLYYLEPSLDGKYVTALSYRADSSQENALCVYSTEGGRPRKYSYGYYNFRAVMIGEDDFLVDEIINSASVGFIPDSVLTYRWSPRAKTKKRFTVDRQVRSSLAIGGSVWVVFQEPSYSFYPWIVTRGDDVVSVAKLSQDLKRIEVEKQLTEE